MEALILRRPPLLGGRSRRMDGTTRNSRAILRDGAAKNAALLRMSV